MDDNLFTNEKLQRFEQLPSSNEYLKQLNSSDNLPEGFTVQTSYQTSGRGQFGNQWQAERSQNLLFSFLLKPDFLPLRQIFRLNMSVCLALCAAVQPYLPQVKLKWPNDLIYEKNKLAGILIENSLQGSSISSSVIGIGLNVNQTEFDGTQSPASSMRLSGGQSYDLDDLLTAFQGQMEFYYKKLQAHREELKLEYLECLYGYRSWIPFHKDQHRFTARIIDVLDSGELLLEEQNGQQRRYRFKEVRFDL